MGIDPAGPLPLTGEASVQERLAALERKTAALSRAPNNPAAQLLAADQSIPNDASTPVTWSNRWFDNAGLWTPGTKYLKLSHVGLYLVTAQAHFVTNATGRRMAELRVGYDLATAGTAAGGSPYGNDHRSAAASGDTAFSLADFAWVIDEASPAYVWLNVLQASGGALTLNGTNAGTNLTAIWLGAVPSPYL